VDDTGAFASLEAALAVQKELVATTKKDKRVVLWAMQVPAPQADLERFLKPGSQIEYNVEGLGAARTLSRPGFGRVYDFVTAFQAPDGSIKFWEAMPFGETDNPELNVDHKTHLYPRMGTVYFVVPIDYHSRIPQSPIGTEN